MIGLFFQNLNRRDDRLVSSISISSLSIYCGNLLWLLFIFWWIWRVTLVINQPLQEQLQLLVPSFTWLARDFNLKNQPHRHTQTQINQTWSLFEVLAYVLQAQMRMFNMKTPVETIKWYKRYLTFIFTPPFVILFILYFILGICSKYASEKRRPWIIEEEQNNMNNCKSSCSLSFWINGWHNIFAFCREVRSTGHLPKICHIKPGNNTPPHPLPLLLKWNTKVLSL